MSFEFFVKPAESNMCQRVKRNRLISPNLVSGQTLSRGPRWEAGAALAKGGIILLFGLAVIVEIADKIVNGVPPSSSLMLAFGSAALIANLTCLALLWRFRSENVNMSSTFECSRNDVVSNVGVLVAAGLVAMTGAAWPDMAVGAIIALIFLRSAWHVLSEAIPAWRDARPSIPKSRRQHER